MSTACWPTSNLPKWQNIEQQQNILFSWSLGSLRVRLEFACVCVSSSSFKTYLSIFFVENLIASTQSPHKYVSYCFVFILNYLGSVLLLFFFPLLILSVCLNRSSVTENVCKIFSNAPFVFLLVKFVFFFFSNTSKFVQGRFNRFKHNHIEFKRIQKCHTKFVSDCAKLFDLATIESSRRTC